MWTRQFPDYRRSFNPCHRKPLSHQARLQPTATNLSGVRPGDILVMHDTPAAFDRSLALIQRILTTIPYRSSSIPWLE